MRAVIRFGFDQRVLMNVVFVGLVLFAAAVVLPNLAIDRYPNFAFGQASIITSYPGAAPEDVERLVTKPIEDAIRGMKDVEWVSSVSVFGQSELMIKFVDDTDYSALYDEMRLRVLTVQNQLPVVNGDPLSPRFLEIETDAWVPTVKVSLIKPEQDSQLDKRALTLLAEDLRDRLELLPGVKRVDLSGDESQQFVLSLDPGKLERQRVTFADVVRAMRQSGQSLPAGTLTTMTGERTIRVDTRYRKRADMLGVVVRRDGDGHFVTVADLVDPASTGIRRVESTSIGSVNGRDSVGCNVLKTRDASTLDLREQVADVVEDFRAANADQPVDITYVLDSSLRIKDQLSVLYDSFMLALALVMATLFFFLTRRSPLIKVVASVMCLATVIIISVTQARALEIGALAALTIFVFLTCRSAVLTVSGIVFSFLGTLTIFYVTGQSINEISLLGFVLVCGVIVDDAIIVLENVRRHREAGASIAKAAFEGSVEVFWPVVSATLTTIAAFLPMLLMTGSTGEFFAILPISVSIALVVSLVECLLILPIHVVELDELIGHERNSSAVDDDVEGLTRRHGWMGWLARIYDHVLCWNLKHRFATLGIVAMAFVFAILVVVESAIGPAHGLAPILKMRFFPEDLSVLNVAVRLPNGQPLEATDRVVREISRKLIAKGPTVIASSSATAGMTLDSTYRPVWNHQYGFLLVELPPRVERSFQEPEQLIEDLRTELVADYQEQGIAIEVSGQQDGPPTGAPVSLRVSGNDEASVERLALDLFAWLGQSSRPGGPLEGVIELSHDRERIEEQVSFVPDQRAMAALGISPEQVQAFIAGAFDGLFVGDYLRRDDEIPVRLRLKRSVMQNPTHALSIPIANDDDGRVVRFSDLGRMESRVEGASLRRRDFQRTISISGNLADSAAIGAQHVTDAVREWYRARANQYPGAEVAFGGEAEHTAKSFRSLGLAFLLAVFLIYLILAAQFQSYLQPLIILSNVVFSFIGVVLVMGTIALGLMVLPDGWVREERSMLTIMSFIAMVGLSGIVVNDAIVLIDFINRRQQDGLPLDRALRLAGLQRMRPILMTTISTIAGLIPMAAGIPFFSTQWSPFATCFVSGLVVSTAMTLLVVPVLYSLLDSWLEWWHALFAKRHRLLRRATDSSASATPTPPRSRQA